MKKYKVNIIGSMYGILLLLLAPFLFFRSIAIIENRVSVYDFEHYFSNFDHINLYYLFLCIIGVLGFLLLGISLILRVTGDETTIWRPVYGILVSFSFIALATLVINDPNPVEFRRFGRATWFENRWDGVEWLIESDAFHLIYIPEIGDGPSLAAIDSRRMLSILHRERIIMRIYRPNTDIHNVGTVHDADTIDEFHEQINELGIESLPALLIVGQGEVEQIALDGDLFNVLNSKLPEIERPDWW